MRRILVAIGIVVTLTGALVLWPLGQLMLTHEHGQARALGVFREDMGDGDQRLRVVWEARVAPGHWLIADRQADQFFRPTGDPELTRADADAATARIMPDGQGRQPTMPVFWRANDPAGTAFIIDVSASHWLRRYLAGAALLLGGLILARISWRRAAR